MLANALIGLREGLEAGLVVGLLIAFLNKLGRRDVLPKLWIGIAAAIVISLGVGALLTFGPHGLPPGVQEGLGGSLSIVAVGLVTWMIFWMARHARHLKGELQGQLSAAIASSAVAIAVLGAVSVGREGVETALFVWANIASSGQQLLGSIGALLGILASIVISYLIYRGFVRINLSRFFFWTGLFLVLVAAGVFADGLGNLQEAGILPAGATAYNLSAAIPASSWYGTLLSGILQFKAAPSWLQVIGWALYAATVLAFFLKVTLHRALSSAAGSATAPDASDPSDELSRAGERA